MRVNNAEMGKIRRVRAFKTLHGTTKIHPEPSFHKNKLIILYYSICIHNFHL